MDTKELGFDTKLVHAGEPKPLVDGALVAPIFQSSTYAYGGEGNYNDIRYIRLNNTPNHTSVAGKLAALEKAEAGQVTASGMAAITTSLLALVGEGEHLLAQDSLYGGTLHFLEENFPGMGRKVTFFPIDEMGSLEKYLQPNTKAIYVESVSNPLLRVPDLKAAVRFARKHKLISFIDNTFPSPMNFTPIDHGFDIVLHSATKYLNGHTDVVAGMIAGSAANIRKITLLLNHLGGSLDPHACFLLNRGMKTLAVRVRHQNESAMQLATFLEGHAKIERVFYPGLASHPDHARAKELLRGFGGMVAIDYKGSAKEADQFMARLQIPVSAPSLGGVESLITRPMTTSHSGVSSEVRARLGIGDSLLRISVGLEDPNDLIADFQNALRGSF